ncbi:MAG: lysylphosphatidylglycerol synthase transmembrane domain-containing protein [Planctomycetota bacterium]
MSASNQARLKNALRLTLPAGIIVFLLWRLEPEDWNAIQEHSIGWPRLLGAFCIALIAIATSYMRWWILVLAQGIRLSVLEAFRISAICFLLSFVSVGSVGGDLFKAVFLAKRSPGKKVASIASVFVDRATGLYGLFVVVAAGLWLRERSDSFEFAGLGIEQYQWIVLGLLVGATMALLLLVLGGKTVDRLVQSAESWPLVGSVIRHAAPPLRTFHEHPGALLCSLALSVVVQSLLVVSFDQISGALGSEPPTLSEHFVIVPLSMLASALPITPGGVGVLEAALEALYSIVPARVPDVSGTLVGLFFEFVKLAIAMVGTAFYWTAGREVRESLDAADALSESEAAAS